MFKNFNFRSNETLFFNVCETIGKPQSWDTYLINSNYNYKKF